MLNTDYQKREADAVSRIKKAIPLRFKRDIVEESKGMFAELYKNPLFPDHFLACAIDGVGTKLILAQALDKYDTVGIDLVAMSANDLATLGNIAPFLFIDYLAVQEKAEEKAGEIIKGMVKGLEQCELKDNIHLNFGKGETASVDELIGGVKEDSGFDIAGAMIGFIRKEHLRTKVNVGDKIIALKSSGAHSNGYTDLRHCLLCGEFESRLEFKRLYKGRHLLFDEFEDTTIGEELLKPTAIYLQTIAEIAKKHEIIGINNTGYGLKNFNRIKQKAEFRITNPVEPQPIFKLMQEDSKFSDEQMYKRFNMGMGFFVIAKKDEADSILRIAKKHEPEIVGEVKKSNKTRTILIKDKKKIVYDGY